MGPRCLTSLTNIVPFSLVNVIFKLIYKSDTSIRKIYKNFKWIFPFSKRVCNIWCKLQYSMFSWIFCLKSKLFFIWRAFDYKLYYTQFFLNLFRILERWIWEDNCLRCLCQSIRVTLAIFRLSGNTPRWNETLKTWNRIFFKL